MAFLLLPPEICIIIKKLRKKEELHMTKKPDIKGVIPAIVTPFDKKTEEFNEERYRALAPTVTTFRGQQSRQALALF